jgi:hypothetical protein
MKRTKNCKNLIFPITMKLSRNVVKFFFMFLELKILSGLEVSNILSIHVTKFILYF